MPTVELQSVQISTDEGNLFYVGNFTLSNYLDNALFPLDTPFSFNMYGEVYSFIVDSRRFEKPEIDPGANLQVSLTCLSPAVQLISPRAQLITKTWPSTTAKAVCEEVLNGFPMTWEILDWPLSNNLFSVSEQAPLDIVKTLVESVGAVVESLPNGDLIVRYKFPVSVPLYDATTKDHTISESDEMVQGSEGYTATRLYDKFRIMDSQSSLGGDRLEFEEVTSGSGIIRAYPSPWRTNFEVVSTLSSVSIGPQTYEEREETQTVEVVNGSANVQYPVLSLVSAVFLDTDLTGVQVTVGSTEIKTTNTTQLYSLLKITYKVRSLRYDVTGPAGSQAQFLMREL